MNFRPHSASRHRTGKTELAWNPHQSPSASTRRLACAFLFVGNILYRAGPTRMRYFLRYRAGAKPGKVDAPKTGIAVMPLRRYKTNWDVPERSTDANAIRGRTQGKAIDACPDSCARGHAESDG